MRRPARAGLRLAAFLALLPLGATAQTPTTAPGAATAYAVVLAARLNLREAPTLQARVRAVAERGDTLCVTRFSGDWAEVFVPGAPPDADPLRGFAARGFLSERRASAEALERVGCTGLRPPDPRLPFKARSQSSRSRHRGAALFHVLNGVQRRASAPIVDGFGSEFGGVPKRSNGTDCKSVGNAFGGSNPPPTTAGRRQSPDPPQQSEAGVAQLARASAFQAEGRGFESRLPL